jgi:hypothetical protein
VNNSFTMNPGGIPMSRFATILFPPVLALALMSGLGTFATFASVAFADDPVGTPVPLGSTGDCSDSGCNVTNSVDPCTDFACNGDLNNCSGCKEYNSLEGSYCGCANK